MYSNVDMFDELAFISTQGNLSNQSLNRSLEYQKLFLSHSEY